MQMLELWDRRQGRAASLTPQLSRSSACHTLARPLLLPNHLSEFSWKTSFTYWWI